MNMIGSKIIEYEDVYNGLCEVSKELNCSSFNDIRVFEKYMEDNNIFKIDFDKDILIKNLNLNDNSYIVFCWDKNDYYHMVSIIDNVIYDKSPDCMDLYVMSIYRKIEYEKILFI